MSAESLKDTEPNDAADPDSSAVSDPPTALAELAADRDRLAVENAELQDRLLRAQAEFQNSRRRVEKEKVEWHEYAATEAVRSLLPIFDDFERALKTECPDAGYAKGMELIYQRLFDALKKLGLEPIVSVGRPFDPHVHHAVEKMETGDAPPDTVLEEYQRGYNFKGRLLREAMVKVAVEPSEAD